MPLRIRFKPELRLQTEIYPKNPFTDYYFAHISKSMANFPNLRRLFIEARSDDEEREISRRAFYNAVLFMGSVAIFSLIAQKMNAGK
ncbi:hypothetical protein Daesc_005976 [Daldinia eschscholtzii]|uniref:Uncharacterized protein n=1 Tax=Daldinia eschscholtzii TaxID=292717 RepID=A0AAX6MNB3_9PEZI